MLNAALPLLSLPDSMFMPANRRSPIPNMTPSLLPMFSAPAGGASTANSGVGHRHPTPVLKTKTQKPKPNCWLAPAVGWAFFFRRAFALSRKAFALARAMNSSNVSRCTG